MNKRPYCIKVSAVIIRKMANLLKGRDAKSTA